MNKYETIFLVKENLSESERKEILKKVKDYINNNGKIEEIEDIGLRNLAYEIKKNKRAYYYLIYFYAESDKIAGLEKLYRVTDEVLKFITMTSQENNDNE